MSGPVMPEDRRCEDEALAGIELRDRTDRFGDVPSRFERIEVPRPPWLRRTGEDRRGPAMRGRSPHRRVLHHQCGCSMVATL